MRMWLALSMALMLGTVACAPRQSKTHYNRWAEETEKRKEEEAKEEAAKGKATADTKKGQPSTTSRTTPPPPPGDYSSLPPGDTPDITRTATKSRVIRPEPPPPPPDDGDVIY